MTQVGEYDARTYKDGDLNKTLSGGRVLKNPSKLVQPLKLPDPTRDSGSDLSPSQWKSSDVTSSITANASGAHRNATRNAGASPHEAFDRQNGNGASSPVLSTAEGQRAAEGRQDFWQYVSSEVYVSIKAPKKDDFFGETRRDKLYNSLFLVGPHLERYMTFGFLVCLDCFLAVLALLPLRMAKSVRRISSGQRLTPEQLFDVCVFAVWILSCCALVNVKAGYIYFWMKDITPEFLKIHALYGALDILEKVLANFGIDTIAAVAGTCNMLCDVRSADKATKRCVQLGCDLFIAWLVMTLHGVVIMCQGLIYAVALNGSRNALVALLIACQFMEVKGIVYKKFDEGKLFHMALLDLTERFTLFVALTFVVAEDMVSTASLVPDGTMLVECVKIFACEIVLDALKHASLAKFNDVRPGMYREFFRSLTGDVEFSQSHTVNRVVGIEPFGMAALVVRQLYMLLLLKASALSQVSTDGADAPLELAGFSQIMNLLDCLIVRGVQCLGLTMLPGWEYAVFAAAAALYGFQLWVFLLTFKMGLGFCLKEMAWRYNRHYDRSYKRMFRAKR